MEIEPRYFIYISPYTLEPVPVTEREAEAWTYVDCRIPFSLHQVSEETYYRVIFAQKYPRVEQPDSVDKVRCLLEL